MRVLAELNLNCGGRPVNREPPTQFQVVEFQNEFGVVLPEEYLQFLRHSNGGHPEVGSFSTKRNVDRFEEISEFYFLDANQEAEANLFKMAREWRSRELETVIPIAQDGGGNQVLFVYGTRSPSVQFWIYDEQVMLEVADSFAEFIDGLRSDPGLR